MNAKEVLEFAKKNNVVMVDLRFTDWPGTWQHCSFPVNEIAEEHFEDGLGFDGSSIRGWQSINESDMLMVPDPDDRLHRSVLQASDPGAALRHHRSDHQGALLARSALHRAGRPRTT